MQTTSMPCPRCTGGLIGWGKNERWCPKCQGRGSVAPPIAGGCDPDVVNGVPLLGSKLKLVASEFLDAASRLEWEPGYPSLKVGLAVDQMLALLDEYESVWKPAIEQYVKEVESEMVKP